MKTRDTINEQVIPQEPGRSQGKGRSWLAGVGAILIVALVVAASVLVFAQLGQQLRNKSQLPPAGKWVQALNGYTLASLEAAAGDPSILYACAIHSETGNNTSYTMLRSTDFGTHWQDIGSKASLKVSCQLAINPKNSNELFAAGIPDPAHSAPVLKHSIDGGQTWTTIQPALYISNINTAPAWNVEQLSMVDNTLYGVQWIPQNINPAMRLRIPARYYARLNRLVKSTDGGHTWTLLDQQFTSPLQGVSSYAVDPANARNIYEVVRFPWLPILPGKAEPNDTLPVYGINSELYKTTDGGATWHLLLQKLPFAAQVQLANDNPQIVYAGGSGGVLPYLEKVPGAETPRVDATGFFSLQMSSDGGGSWRVVPELSQSSQASNRAYLQTWFVSSHGQVYTYSTLSPTSIQRYDPSSNAWSEVTTPPTSGTLLTVTPGNANSDVLWFAATYKGQSTLYRYVS